MKASSRAALIWTASALAIALGAWLYHRTSKAAPRGAMSHRELATRFLAQYIEAHYSGKPVLVVSNPFTQKAGRDPQIYAFEEAGLSGLRKGFGKATPMKVVFPDVRPEFLKNPRSVQVDPRTTTPLSFLVAENAFDKLAKENPECDLIVSLIGLPVNLAQVEIWRKPDVPKFALLLPDWRFLGSQQAIQGAVKSGKIVAAILNKPGAPPETVFSGGDDKTEFDKRFLLVTAENIDNLMRSHPQLF